MKKLQTLLIYAFTTCCLFISVAQAQIELGGGFALGTDDGDLGILVKGRYRITDQFAVSPNVTYFFVEDISVVDLNFWTINLDAHYLFLPKENLFAYPLFGFNLGIASMSIDGFGVANESETETEFGVNVGGGSQYQFTERLGGFMEVKYVISDFDQLVISLGVLFSIN